MPKVFRIIGPLVSSPVPTNSLPVFYLIVSNVLPIIIAPNQLAFVENRQILDASHMANELIDDCSHNKKEGVVLKHDLEKAFDTVERDFLDSIL